MYYILLYDNSNVGRDICLFQYLNTIFLISLSFVAKSCIFFYSGTKNHFQSHQLANILFHDLFYVLNYLYFFNSQVH